MGKETSSDCRIFYGGGTTWYDFGGRIAGTVTVSLPKRRDSNVFVGRKTQEQQDHATTPTIAFSDCLWDTGPAAIHDVGGITDPYFVVMVGQRGLIFPNTVGSIPFTQPREGRLALNATFNVRDDYVFSHVVRGKSFGTTSTTGTDLIVPNITDPAIAIGVTAGSVRAFIPQTGDAETVKFALDHQGNVAESTNRDIARGLFTLPTLPATLNGNFDLVGATPLGAATQIYVFFNAVADAVPEA